MRKCEAIQPRKIYSAEADTFLMVAGSNAGSVSENPKPVCGKECDKAPEQLPDKAAERRHQFGLRLCRNGSEFISCYAVADTSGSDVSATDIG